MSRFHELWRFHETVVTNFSGARTLSHLVGGQKNFTTNFHVHIRYYGSMATTTTTTCIFLMHFFPLVFLYRFIIFINNIFNDCSEWFIGMREIFLVRSVRNCSSLRVTWKVTCGSIRTNDRDRSSVHNAIRLL